jgi:class 3 adenylate cyclase
MLFDSKLRSSLKRYLPDDLLQQLPEAQALTAAIRRMNSLHQSLSSFLPQYIGENEKLYTETYSALRPGTFLFADVSGFTALSEKLQRTGGREGTDILTEVISDFFSRMLEILAKSNGQMLKFAGDALLTFFPSVAGDDESPFAIRTGLRMQREMAANFQPITHPALKELFGEHDLKLTMSIGVCKGKLFEAVVGNNVQRDHIIQGDLPGQAMAAEAVGEHDDVIITADLQQAHAHLFETVPVADGFFRVVDNFGDQLSDYEFAVPRRRRAATALFDFAEENLLEDLKRQLERLDGIARFVAREVVDKLAFKGDRIESENRQATVIFLHFTGFADLLQRWGDDQLPLLVSILDRYYNLIQRTIVANGGVLARSDPYQRGVKLLITFGAPVAHLDDPERAVTTALEMNRVLIGLNARLKEELPDHLRGSDDVFITQRCGITHGMTFAGLVGPMWRREYTVMGDDVNLAARFMGKGQIGQIIISDRMWDRVHPHFETQALPPFQLKGKSQPTQAYLVQASTFSPLNVPATSETPFVGRDLQMLSLTYGLQQAKGPRRRQVFALCGEAGVGKTRMIKKVAQEAETSGFRVAWANCQLSYSLDQQVWAALIFQLLQLDEAKSEPARRRLLEVRLKELDLEQLETVFSLLLFGSTEHQQAGLPSLTASVSEPAAPENEKKKANIFEMAQIKTDLAKSGIFGIARDQLKAMLEAAEKTDHAIWQTVQKQTSLPDSIVHFLQQYAEHTPTLLILDDLHRSDPTALGILNRVLDEISKARLMIMVAYEPMNDEALHIRRKTNIGDLDEGETTQMILRVLKVSDVGDRLCRIIWERTKGRPLFIESLLGLLQRDQQIEIANGQADLKGDSTAESLPDNVRELITSQIDRLTAEARELLQVASVLGDSFTAEAVIGLAGSENAIRLENLLGELLYTEIIEPQPDGSYRFRHGLTQATVYESLNRLQRQKLHRAAADLLRGQKESDRFLLKVVYHLVKGGLPMRGIEMISQAADQAEQDRQLDRAIELYTHAREIFPHDESVRVQLERLEKIRG